MFRAHILAFDGSRLFRAMWLKSRYWYFENSDFEEEWSVTRPYWGQRGKWLDDSRSLCLKPYAQCPLACRIMQGNARKYKYFQAHVRKVPR